MDSGQLVARGSRDLGIAQSRPGKLVQGQVGVTGRPLDQDGVGLLLKDFLFCLAAGRVAVGDGGPVGFDGFFCVDVFRLPVWRGMTCQERHFPGSIKNLLADYLAVEHTVERVASADGLDAFVRMRQSADRWQPHITSIVLTIVINQFSALVEFQ